MVGGNLSVCICMYLSFYVTLINYNFFLATPTYGVYYPICGSVCPRTHLTLNCNYHTVFINHNDGFSLSWVCTDLHSN